MLLPPAELHFAEEFKITFSGHLRRTQIVSNDEDRNLVVHGNYQGSCNAGLGIDQVITMLSLELEAVLLKDLRELPVIDRGDSWHVSALEPTESFPEPQSPVPSTR